MCGGDDEVAFLPVVKPWQEDRSGYVPERALHLQPLDQVSAPFGLGTRVYLGS